MGRDSQTDAATTKRSKALYERHLPSLRKTWLWSLTDEDPLIDGKSCARRIVYNSYGRCVYNLPGRE